MKINITIDTKDLSDIIDILDELLDGNEIYWGHCYPWKENFKELNKSLKNQLTEELSKEL